jgi:tubulin gamma
VALSKKSPYVHTSHRVSGLMLANHTSIRHLFSKILRDYDRLVQRRAFLDPYTKFDMFADAKGQLVMDEWDEAREVVAGLAAEYEACEKADYVSAPRAWRCMKLQLCWSCVGTVPCCHRGYAA